jgi:hypothetical protein
MMTVMRVEKREFAQEFSQLSCMLQSNENKKINYMFLNCGKGTQLKENKLQVSQLWLKIMTVMRIVKREFA